MVSLYPNPACSSARIDKFGRFGQFYQASEETNQMALVADFLIVKKFLINTASSLGNFWFYWISRLIPKQKVLSLWSWSVQVRKSSFGKLQMLDSIEKVGHFSLTKPANLDIIISGTFYFWSLQSVQRRADKCCKVHLWWGLSPSALSTKNKILQEKM